VRVLLNFALKRYGVRAATGCMLSGQGLVSACLGYGIRRSDWMNRTVNPRPAPLCCAARSHSYIIIIIIIYLTANGLSPGGSGYNACT
jgi:hypothetical protein